MAVWPGPADWQTRHRKQNSLRKLERFEDAKKELDEAKRIEKLMSTEEFEQARLSLGQLGTRECYQLLGEFYENLQMPRLAKAWRDQLEVEGNVLEPGAAAKNPLLNPGRGGGPGPQPQPRPGSQKKPESTPVAAAQPPGPSPKGAEKK